MKVACGQREDEAIRRPPEARPRPGQRNSRSACRIGGDRQRLEHVRRGERLRDVGHRGRQHAHPGLMEPRLACTQPASARTACSSHKVKAERIDQQRWGAVLDRFLDTAGRALPPSSSSSSPSTSMTVIVSLRWTTTGRRVATSWASAALMLVALPTVARRCNQRQPKLAAALVDSADERAGPQQRPRERHGRRAADDVRARLRLRPEHVALRRAGVRGRLPGRAVRPRRRRRVRPAAPTTRSATPRSTATPTTCSRSAASSTSPDVVFVGHSVSAMIGVLAAARAPELFAALVLVGPSPRYIDDDGYVGGFSEARHRRAARVARQQLPRLVERDGAGDHGQRRPAGAGRGADRQLLPHRPGDRAPLRAGHVPVRQPRRPGDGRGADAGAAVQRRRDRARRRSASTCTSAIPAATLVLLEATGHCPNLSAPEETIAAIRRIVSL